MLLVDRVVEFESGKRIVGVKNVTSLIGLPSVVNACIAVGVSPRGDVYGLDFRRKIMR